MRKFNAVKNFELFETNGDWEVYLGRPIYKKIQAFGNTRIINAKTGEDCGQLVYLYKTIFDEFGNRLSSPIYDEDCYELIEIED